MRTRVQMVTFTLNQINHTNRAIAQEFVLIIPNLAKCEHTLHDNQLFTLQQPVTPVAARKVNIGSLITFKLF